MTYFKKSDQYRFLLDPTESPTTFRSLQHHENGNSMVSPMTNLAMNLNEAKLAGSPLAQLHPRRLSLSSDVSSPVFSHNGSVETSAVEVGENRLLKNAIKFPGIGKDSSSGRNRSFTRRVNLVASSENTITFGDKENCDVDMSIINSPNKLNISPSKFAMRLQASPLRVRQPLEDQDPNSQDSGYGANHLDKLDPKTGFRFTEPCTMAPRRQLSDQSPLKENAIMPRNKSNNQSQPQKLFRCLSSGSNSDFLDDGFLEFDDKLADVSNLPSGLTSLLSKPIIKEDILLNPLAAGRAEGNPRFLRRSMSLVENVTPNCSRARSCLFKPLNLGSPMQQGDASQSAECDALRSFKRPDPPCDYVSPSQLKRRKANSLYSIHQSSPISETEMKQPKYQRCFSDNEAIIKTALHRSQQDPDLIGDFTKPYILPLIEGRHKDLKTISSETLSKLMDGQYSESVEMFTIVDCRYPYEFDGGHIRGAKNIYTKDQVLKDLVNGMQAEAKCESSMSVKRKHIMVFHCEFSSERGPSLYRFLRNSDRTKNEEFYPALYYPELYLLEGGYKQFFEQHQSMCEPQDYRPMLHPNHETDLRHFRAKTKSWNGDGKSRFTLRNSFKRLGNEPSN